MECAVQSGTRMKLDSDLQKTVMYDDSAARRRVRPSMLGTYVARNACAGRFPSPLTGPFVGDDARTLAAVESNAAVAID